MNRSGRTLGSLDGSRGLHSSIAGVLILLMSAACSGERRSGTVSTDSSAVADTTTAIATDTGKAPSDTAAASTRTDTANLRRDSIRSNPAPAPARARAAARKPAAAKPARTDTTATRAAPTPSATSAPSPDTAASASQGQDSSTAAEQTAAPLRDAYHQAPLDTVPQQVYDGWKQFNLNCARCHGEDVQGTTIAPHLIVSLRPDGPINTKELFIQTVCAGRPAKGMPSWCSLGMEMPTIEAIYSYVKGRSDSKIHPGRPAVKSGG
jgi:cbb3-type cytochrome c oxidase subunit III